MSTGTWSGRGWTLVADDDNAGFTVSLPSGALTLAARDAGRFRVRRGWYRSTLTDGERNIARLRGLSWKDAKALERAMVQVALSAAVDWYQQAAPALHAATTTRRWFTTEMVDALLAIRPPQGLRARIRGTGSDMGLTGEQMAALDLLEADFGHMVADINERVMTDELRSSREFFQTIEKSPLTDEQARAVVCFDNRVQVLAAAGSGKTSVMVARAAFAVARQRVAPDRILLLAFNRAAAAELQERIQARFADAGIDATGVRASTFHALGLDVIGRATGAKPRLASWLERNDGLDEIERIVDELRDRDAQFRYRWDLYRLIFARAPIDVEEDEPDGWDAGNRQAGYRTFGGQIVRSHGERLVADFLYLHGVRYEYERPYTYQVADSSHSQYRPDFYYPDIDVWHEHWALDRDGKPPPSFDGYEEAIDWKRRTHARFGTTLLETTFAGVLWGDHLDRLGRQLTDRGVALDWNPDRPPRDQWVRPLRHEDMYRLVRTFMTHVKSNSWTKEQLETRLAGKISHLAGLRSRLFLDLYWPIAAAWDRRLGAEGAVDFEDMLVQAADHLESGRVDTGNELVMVDEFQDASRARARMVRALLAKPGHYLLAVGDDWQSINRFAGADLSVMTEFATWFGRGPRLALTTTFRCPQSICDVARQFVSKNPRQFQKAMRSARPDPAVAVHIVRTSDPATAVAAFLHQLSERVADGTASPEAHTKVSVDVLGRYGHEASFVPSRPPGNLDVTFRTVHGSKGLEADYIVVPNMVTGTYGFPSAITDDPVLNLVMPNPETFEHAEERRLFYVALTRARRSVTLITDPDRMSPFVVELVATGMPTIDGAPANPAPSPPDGSTHAPTPSLGAVKVCPSCKQGTLVLRTGRFGPFLGCSTFPRCRHTQPIPKSRTPLETDEAR